MKILTWNVNGLRAVLKRSGLDPLLATSPDLICLQEIKARPEQLTEADHSIFADYQVIWNPAERPGYSGVAIACKAPPDEIILGLGDPTFDKEGRIILLRYERIWIANIYFPNGSRDLSRLEYKLAFYESLLELCDRIHAAGELVILCGDFNTAHREIDLKNPRQNRNQTGFLPVECAMIDRYVEHGLVDVYRHIYPTRIQYTWWAYWGEARARNTGWRLDYFLISAELLPQLRDTEIFDEIYGSDHCPVSLWLD